MVDEFRRLRLDIKKASIQPCGVSYHFHYVVLKVDHGVEPLFHPR